MSAIKVTMDGDGQGLLKRLKHLSDIDKRGVLNAIAESLRTSTEERFESERDPDGKSWKQSIRAKVHGGKTLTDTTKLKTSIRATVSSKGLAVGTNDIRAASLQFGDTRTIRAKEKKNLVFKIGGSFRMAKQVTIHIPPRPFLGINDDDMRDIRETLEDAISEGS